MMIMNIVISYQLSITIIFIAIFTTILNMDSERKRNICNEF